MMLTGKYIRRFLLSCTFLFFCQWLAAYNIDSLVTTIGQVPLDDQHKKIEKELTRLRDTNPAEGIELGNYWINILNEKQQSKKAADIILITANCYYRLANYNLNLQYIQTARNLYKMTDDQKGEAMCLKDMGFTYSKMDQNQDAITALQSAAEIFSRMNDYQELAVTYNHMGNVLEKWKNDLTTAEMFYRKSIENAQKVNDKQCISYSLEFIGILKSKLNQNDSAVFYLNQSLALRKQLNNPLDLAISYTNMAEILEKNGNYHEANSYYSHALRISSSIQYHDLTNFLYGNLSKVQRKKGNLDSAITYLELQQALKDSLFNLQKTKEFAKIKAQYEDQLKEEKILTLRNELELDEEKDKRKTYFLTAIIAILGSAVLLGVIIGIMIYNRQQKKVAKEKISQERLRNKMIIEAEEKERTRIAKDLHDSLGQMLAALKMNLNSLSNQSDHNGQFKKTAQILDDTIAEMRSISHAMMPESLVKNGLAQALVDISSHIDTSQTAIHVNVENWKGWTTTGEYVLYRIVQELLNNTLKHADAKNVNIELNQFEDEINLIYEDDGTGFELSGVKSDGIGLQNMNNRISSINGEIQFDSKPGSGTTAIISIPLTHINENP